MDSSNARGSQALGSWNRTSWDSDGQSCSSGFPNKWERASADTPICIARCNPSFDPEHDSDKVSSMYRTICPRRYESTEELPSVCEDGRSVSSAEQIGRDFVEGMQAWYTVPCAG